MKSSKEIIDKEALAKRRAKSDKEDNFLQKLAIQDIKDRLHIIKKRFEKILIIKMNQVKQLFIMHVIIIIVL